MVTTCCIEKKNIGIALTFLSVLYNDKIGSYSKPQYTVYELFFIIVYIYMKLEYKCLVHSMSVYM